MRRRQNHPGGRHIEHRVKVTQEEEEILQTRANAAGITVSRFLMEAALGDPNDVLERKTWRAQLLGLRQQMKESGYSEELQQRASILLQRLGE